MAIELSGQDARRMRWQSQLLGGSDLTPSGVVRRAVALQGQDLPAVLQAIAIRSRPGTTVPEVRAAFDRGELVRGWPMRGTLFATTPEHLAALLFFTGDRIHRLAARRRAELGLDEEAITRGREALLEALADRPLDRAAAFAVWEAAGVPTAAGRGYHLLMHLSVAGLLHWGAFDPTGRRQLVTLSAGGPPEDPDAALAEVVRGFVLARGPVTEADLAWWTKLPRTAVRSAAAAADLVDVEVEGRPAWIVGEPRIPEESGVTLVPGYDEWILGYTDRSLVGGPAAMAVIVPGNNGMFRPAVLVDGIAVGTWRWPRGSRAGVEPVLELVEPVPAATRREIERAVAAWPHR